MFASQITFKTYLPKSEQTYLQEIRAGDRSAFEVVFRTYYADLSRYSLSMIKREDEAEDLVQQVFINLWEKREKTIITGSLKSYLFRSVHNQCLNRIKHEKVKADYIAHSTYYNNKYHLETEENLLAKELSGKIEDAMNELPQQCERIFRMNRHEGLKYKEIAQKLNISIKTVENQIGKALKILRGNLSEYLVSVLLILFGL